MAESKPKPNPPAAATPAAGAATNADADKLVQDALAQAQSSVEEIQAAADSAAGTPLSMPQLDGANSAPGAGAGGAGAAGAQASDIELLSDVDLQVAIELGRTQMLVEDVLKLGDGSVVELDKLAGDPVDVYVNQRLVARGEVLVVNDNFCIRISEIVANLEEQAEQAAQEQAVRGGG